jgi:hypothetical protein
MKHFHRLTLWDENAGILNIKVVVHIISNVLRMFGVHSLITGSKSGSKSAARYISIKVWGTFCKWLGKI